MKHNRTLLIFLAVPAVGLLIGLATCSIILRSNSEKPSLTEAKTPKNNSPLRQPDPESSITRQDNRRTAEMETGGKPAAVENVRKVASAVSLDRALGRGHFTEDQIRDMAVVEVNFTDFEGNPSIGQIVVHKSLEQEVKQIFEEIEESGWPIEKVIPISEYGWHDQQSINDNNTSAFNYRNAIGPGIKPGRLSKHSFGAAIDMNPYQNPFLNSSGGGPRPYRPGTKGTMTSDSPPVRIFKKFGWTWGGDWSGGKDYQHFEKLLPGQQEQRPKAVSGEDTRKTRPGKTSEARRERSKPEASGKSASLPRAGENETKSKTGDAELKKPENLKKPEPTPEKPAPGPEVKPEPPAGSTTGGSGEVKTTPSA